MRNFRFDTGIITGFDAGNNRTGNYLLNLLLGNRQLLSNLRAFSNEFIHNFCRISLASPCRAEQKYERTLLAGYILGKLTKKFSKMSNPVGKLDMPVPLGTEYYTEVHLHCFLRKLYSS
jgi:hypothetical protein